MTGGGHGGGKLCRTDVPECLIPLRIKGIISASSSRSFGPVSGGNGLKKFRSETKTDMDRAVADKNVIGENGARRKALLAFVKPLTCLAAAAIFVIRVVMDYLIHYDKSLMPNARQVEYALIFFWAVGISVLGVVFI